MTQLPIHLFHPQTRAPHVHPLRAVVAVITLALTLICLLSTYGIAAAAQTPAAPESVDQLSKQLQDSRLDLASRRRAAAQLLQDRSIQASAVLVSLLSPSEDPVVLSAICQEIFRLPQAPAPLLAAPLIDLLKSTPESTLPDVANALTRFTDPRTQSAVTALAGDPLQTSIARQHAMSALAARRTQAAAKILIELADPAQPPETRNPACDALIQLTGLSELGRNPARWQQWWQKESQSSESAFQLQLLKNREDKIEARQAAAAEIMDQLVDLWRWRYLSSVAEQQQPVLQLMLSHKLPEIRQTGVELAGQRLADRGPNQISPDLREALRTCLDDPSPAIAVRSGRLLHDLADEPAAVKMAQLLKTPDNRPPELLRWCLLMMARVPQPQAVEPALAMLADDRYQGAAAAALAKAAQSKLLDAGQSLRAAQTLRLAIKNNPTPDPSVIALLSCVSDDAADWQKIRRWLVSPSAPIREAAARAWARTGRPIQTLAQLAADDAVQPVLFDAAQHCDDPAVLKAIADAQPKSDDARNARRAALQAMAALVPSQAALDADAHFQKTETSAFRAAFLTQAADPLLRDGRTLSPLEQATLTNLLLARADVHAADGDYKLALADCQTIEDHKLTLNPDQERRCRMTLLAGKLAENALEESFAVAVKIMDAAGGQSVNRTVSTQVMTLFVTTAESALAAGETEKSQKIIAWTKSLQLLNLEDSLQRRLTTLEEKLVPAPGTPPATQPTPQAAALRPAP